MDESQVTPKPQGNGLLVGILAVIVILVGVVVYMALSKPAEMPEDTSSERQETVTETEEKDTAEVDTEESAITTDEEDTDEGDTETADVDSDLQDLDELNLGDIEDEYSESTIEDLE
ncbi:hypothetical protein KKG08_01140 [Patescibacteria group bacterium]|nr:hypothetical protein [Patescibacteria group bacterium]